MASLSRFIRSVRPEDLRRHLQMHGIIMPDGPDWETPTEQIAERFLRALDRLSDGDRDRLIADAERIWTMADEPGQAALLALFDYRERLLGIEGAHARAHWLYVQSREAFRRAEEIRYADENREAVRLWDGFVGPRLMDIRSDRETDQQFRAQLRNILKSDRIFLEPLTRMRGHADEPTRRIQQVAIYNEGLPSDDLRFEGEEITLPAGQSSKRLSFTSLTAAPSRSSAASRNCANAWRGPSPRPSSASPSRASVCRPGGSISRHCSIPGISWLSIPETALLALNTPC